MWEECVWRNRERKARRVVVKGVGKGEEVEGMVAKRRGNEVKEKERGSSGK